MDLDLDRSLLLVPAVQMRVTGLDEEDGRTTVIASARAREGPGRGMGLGMDTGIRIGIEGGTRRRRRSGRSGKLVSESGSEIAIGIPMAIGRGIPMAIGRGIPMGMGKSIEMTRETGMSGRGEEVGSRFGIDDEVGLSHVSPFIWVVYIQLD